MAINLQHQTLVEFSARLRNRYRNSSREDAARIATFILNKIESGDVTELQIRNVFNLTVTQWTTLKAKMTTLRTGWLAIQAAQGE